MRKNLKLIIVMTAFISFLLVAPSCISDSFDGTQLEINNVKGVFGGVTVDIKNIGDEVAEDIAILIVVNGGLFGNIDMIKECAGCGACGTTLAPDAIKSESTTEAGYIIGLGPVDITVSSWATNAPEVTEDLSGFVIGPFILIL
jgi:hypothetical protein